MARVVKLASDGKGSAAFECRWMPKGAHSQRLHGVMVCTERKCVLFFIGGNITTINSSLTGVTGRGSHFPGQSTMQFASVVSRMRNLPIS
jgi:hypothetical protein